MAAADTTIVLITGANTGIGWETVKALVQSKNKYLVLVGTRDLEKGKQALEKLNTEVTETISTTELLQVDVASDESISNAFDRVQATHGYIDVLVNNAGIALDAEYVHGGMSMREAWNNAYDVNPSSAFLSQWLSKHWKMSEGFYPMPGPIPAGWPKKAAYLPSSYRISKTALNMAMLSWHWLLKEDGVKVWCVSPGYLATGLGGERSAAARRGAAPASIGGKLLIGVIEGERDLDTGKVIDINGVQSF